MKIQYLLLLFFGCSLTHLQAQTVSIEDFQRTTSSEERKQIIAQTPVDQRPELIRIDRHLRLVARHGGEEGLCNYRKMWVAQARGTAAPVALITAQGQIWDEYIGTVFSANSAAGMPPEHQDIILHNLQTERAKLGERMPFVDDLVFRVAPTPQAAKLNQVAEALCDQLMKRDEYGYLHRFTNAEREALDREVNRILTEWESLPKLTPEQAQKEYDAFTENRIPLYEGGLN